MLQSQGDGTLTVIKEKSPTSFVVEQTVQTMAGAKTLTLDSKTGKVLLIAAEYGPAQLPRQKADSRQREGHPKEGAVRGGPWFQDRFRS